jgi:hypothetical protein
MELFHLYLPAEDINGAGRIVGYGIINGKEHAYLATPISEPSTMLLLTTGLGSMICHISRKGSVSSDTLPFSLFTSQNF